MSTIKLIDTNGTSHILDAVEGWRVMEIIREHGFEVGGLCGGACACATCHVYVEPDWLSKVGARNPMEEDMLDFAFDVRDSSRLSCQIKVSDALNGLRVRVPEKQF